MKSELDKGAETANGDPTAEFADKWFTNEMLRLARGCKESFERMQFRAALKFGFHEFQEARDKYRLLVAAPNPELIKQFVRWQAQLLAPICPHWSEAVWEMLGLPGCIVLARWPNLSQPHDPALEAHGNYVFGAVREMRSELDKKIMSAKGVKPPKPERARIYVARKAPEWKVLTVQVLLEHFDADSCTLLPSAMQALGKTDELKARGKHPSIFAATLRAELEGCGGDAVRARAAFDLAPPFNEVAVLLANERYILSALDVTHVQILHDESEDVPEPKALESASPLKPVIVWLAADGTLAFPAPAGGGGGGKPAGGGGGGGKPAPASGEAGGKPVPAPAGGGKGAAKGTAKVPAKDYVERHQLAEALHDAVNAAVLAQPEDALSFIADELRKRAAAQKGGK